MRRRSVLFGICCACVARPVAAGPLPTVEIAPGVHVRRGADEDADAANGDAIANIGFVVGGRSVAVIDPGGSMADGVALRARIRSLTDKPVSHVVLTHVHPDHVFGAAAFRPDAPLFVGHARLPDALRARGAYYREGLAAMLGDAEAGDVVVPDHLIENQEQIDLGDRVLMLSAHPVAHTNCDLSVLDAASGTWFTGDLLFVDRVPSLDGSLRGWIAELERLQSRPVARAVPGHGPVGVAWPDAATAELRYLRRLRQDVAGLIARGGTIEQAPDMAADERPHWKLFDDYNGRNATEAFRELEWE